MLRFEFESGIIQWSYLIIFVSCGESRLIVSWCVVDRCNVMSNDGDLGRSRRTDTEDQK
jgi:hypothetical protein